MDEQFDYWVTISSAKGRCGAGFLLTRRYALTAAHCLRNKATEDDEVTVVRDTDSATGRVVQVDKQQDVALIRIDSPLSWTRLPISTDRCEQGDSWLSPYRPPSSQSQLKGLVLTAPTEFTCGGGGVIEALELKVHQELGGYRGYSGSPVERQRDDPDSSTRLVVGMLLEQDFNRINKEEATNVLFAVTVQHAMAAFDLLDTPNQHARLSRTRPAPAAPRPTSESYFSGARSAVHEIRRMVAEGFLPERDAAELVLEAVREATRRVVEGGGGGQPAD